VVGVGLVEKEVAGLVATAVVGLGVEEEPVDLTEKEAAGKGAFRMKAAVE
jgi:hypothetical protein